MFKLSTLRTSMLAAALLACTATFGATMTKADYKAAKQRIGVDYKADKAACGSMSANAKDICIEEAKGKDKVALAELEYGYTGKAGDRTKSLEAKAHAVFAVAKERCDDLAGNAKDVCVKEAKAVHIKSLADAKMGKEILAARTEAMTDKRDADYKVAIEKCDALTAAAKTSCVNSAKASFGKT